MAIESTSPYLPKPLDLRPTAPAAKAGQGMGSRPGQWAHEGLSRAPVAPGSAQAGGSPLAPRGAGLALLHPAASQPHPPMDRGANPSAAEALNKAIGEAQLNMYFNALEAYKKACQPSPQEEDEDDLDPDDD